MSNLHYAAAFASVAIALAVNMALVLRWLPKPTLRAHLLFFAASVFWPVGIPLWAVYCYRDRFDLRYPKAATEEDWR